jgi:hypothetical protein
VAVGALGLSLGLGAILLFTRPPGESRLEPPLPPAVPNQRMPPPQRAVEACSGKAAGTPCSFRDRWDRPWNGRCWSPVPSFPLACDPRAAKKR